MSSNLKKLKVVWICHFSNEHVQQKLNVKRPVREFAPWISLGIEEVKKRKDIELHVISPHRWITSNKEFKEKNVIFCTKKEYGSQRLSRWLGVNSTTLPPACSLG